MTDDELVALGLCEPDRLDSSRPAFVRMLLDAGATVDEIRAAVAQGQSHLSALAVALVVYPPGRMDLDEVARKAEVSPDDVRAWWHHIGWPDPTAPDARFNDFDLRLVEILKARFPMGILPANVIEDYLRITSAAVSDIAESMLNTLRVGLDQPARERGASAYDISRAHQELLGELLPEFFEAMALLFRRAVVTGASSTVSVNAGGEVWSERTMVFVDLVDYTALAQRSGAELRAVLDEFELAVTSCATDYRGRLVKLLGDGAMLTFTSRDDGIRAARALVSDPQLPPCRAGVATGQVMMRHADFFGPVVNLASRLSSIVEAGEVAVDNTVDLAGAERMDPTPLKGIDEPLTPFRIGTE